MRTVGPISSLAVHATSSGGTCSEGPWADLSSKINSSSSLITRDSVLITQTQPASLPPTHLPRKAGTLAHCAPLDLTQLECVLRIQAQTSNCTIHAQPVRDSMA